ncbi:MAG: hypothetical protein ACK4JX_04680 [Flavobacterium sp.]
MKTKVLFWLLLPATLLAQSHFMGTNTSRRVGVIHSTLNPADLSNLHNKVDIHVFGSSIIASNNKLTFKDFFEDNVEERLFSTEGNVNANVSAQFVGPGVAFKVNKWAFCAHVATNANIWMHQLNSPFIDAVINSDVLLASTAINATGNQRFNGMSWGEINLSISRVLLETEKHQFNAGITGKLLFPGTFGNGGIQSLQGNINTIGGITYLSNATATINFAYSGILADDFNNSSNYTKSMFGGFNGFGVDLGVTYSYKKDDKTYLKAGASVRNIGTMTFKNENNSNRTWQFNSNNSGNPNGLNLDQFSGVNSLSEIEQILINSGTLTPQSNTNEVKVNLPTLFNAYVQWDITKNFLLDAYLQQSLHNQEDNLQIANQNTYALIPRLKFGSFEVSSPLAINQDSNFTSGIGLRLGGFYLGSNSAITTLLNNSKVGDVYFGLQFGI